MNARAFRCAVDAERRGDSMLGTAPPLGRILLVHQPGPWGPRGLLESRCDPEVARRIDVAAANSGMRLQAIRRPGKHEVGTPAGGYRVGIVDTLAENAAITWWQTGDLATIAAELEAGRPSSAPVEVDGAPLFLVCAHGRHDACCALRGGPVAAALERVRPGRVWETTHLGGDRFAANVLVLPAGELYGRITPDGVPEFADRIEAGDVVPDRLRGRIGLEPIAQAALIYAYERLGITTRNALRATAVQRIDADRARVTITTPHGTVAATMAIETTPAAQLTCRGPQAARAREYRGVAIDVSRSPKDPA